MGYERAELTITARLSRHNSERDAAHDELWDTLVKDIEALIESPEFADISPMIS